jgi:adenine-specific DNA methylase
MIKWGDLFTSRQKLALITLASFLSNRISADKQMLEPLAFLNTRVADKNASLVSWDSGRETVGHVFSRQALPIVWDFAESGFPMQSNHLLDHALSILLGVVRNCSRAVLNNIGQVQLLDACDSSLPLATGDIWFTDPPYYDAVPYADLSDFFFVWLKRVLPNNMLIRDPFDSQNILTPKAREIVQDEVKKVDGHPKDRVFFERMMAKAFEVNRGVLKDSGIGCVVFAHKTTEGWEALLSGMIRGGWVITSSWPIATERPGRLRSQDSAALATSVHLVCRPRTENKVGDWGEVLRALPKRVGDWMERLQSEGIRGADLVFACIGPALEIFSRYSKVVDAEEREIPLGGNPEASEPYQRGFLSYVWEVVGRTALEQVLGTAEAKSRNGAAGAVEEDARLTALFLWTLQSTDNEGKSKKEKGKNEEIEEEAESEDDDEEKPKKKKQGFSLIFDVVRRFAQPLGIHLPEWEGRIIETEKGVVRLLSISERSKQLFGEEGFQAVADKLESSRQVSPQLMLFPQTKKDSAPEIKGRGHRKKSAGEVSDESLKTQRGATTLDRVHAAMLLQASGRANALRALLKEELERGPDFLRLANALSALYPKDSEEKRLLDAMLLAMPR